MDLGAGQHGLLREKNEHGWNAQCKSLCTYNSGYDCPVLTADQTIHCTAAASRPSAPTLEFFSGAHSKGKISQKTQFWQNTEIPVRIKCTFENIRWNVHRKKVPKLAHWVLRSRRYSSFFPIKPHTPYEHSYYECPQELRWQQCESWTLHHYSSYFPWVLTWSWGRYTWMHGGEEFLQRVVLSAIRLVLTRVPSFCLHNAGKMQPLCSLYAAFMQPFVSVAWPTAVILLSTFEQSATAFSARAGEVTVIKSRVTRMHRQVH